MDRTPCELVCGYDHIGLGVLAQWPVAAILGCDLRSSPQQGCAVLPVTVLANTRHAQAGCASASLPLRAFYEPLTLLSSGTSPVTLLSPSQNYLAARGWTWRTVLTESLVALQRGVFLLSGELSAAGGARALPGRCGRRRGPGAAPAQTLRPSACWAECW